MSTGSFDDGILPLCMRPILDALIPHLLDIRIVVVSLCCLCGDSSSSTGCMFKVIRNAFSTVWFDENMMIFGYDMPFHVTYVFIFRDVQHSTYQISFLWNAKATCEIHATYGRLTLLFKLDRIETVI